MPTGYSNASIPSAFGGPTDGGDKIPLLFQVLSIDYESLLLPEALYLHINPTSLSLNYSKVVERIQTRGGWHEQHFGDQLVDVSAEIVSGAFINVDTGLAVQNRRETIAYEKFHHLLDLFHNNGLIYDTQGNVQYRGRIRMIFEGGIYDGSFRSFNVSESSSQPFMLSGDFAFRAEEEVVNLIT
jgi:hypothetical protein